MTEKEQTYESSVLNQNAIPSKSVQEIDDVYEDIEMANVERAPIATIENSQIEDNSPVDAVTDLRVTLEGLRQQIARAVISGASQEDLRKLQERAVSIKNCIVFLDEAQAFCVTPSLSANESIPDPKLSNTTIYPRSDHIIPSDLPLMPVGPVWSQ
ncbi:hypothetical protein G6F22_018000 [Rhizopus arrhizus]|uniref:Uncharacterized protein n=1 Tax=Rhizopus oryzae TaxID=64495 RepID=A0A9P6WUZ9_RHIOR|nr:hypothetical protein G6F22_018000 [Rhizopus arrhizus]KAG0803091.1 hypothetical protein G6F20_013835 [Rhizopus arrhizus]KAG0806963.1 hypothetical protein G6F19_013890 [Rhizopus arrhizus]KAG0878912.1 hypothetical protein G6F34_013918 [Rhizopus arrhizus]KAG0928407.1 hypothetical protein G6F31_017734 [Rhizopus arrhizus]